MLRGTLRARERVHGVRRDAWKLELVGFEERTRMRQQIQEQFDAHNAVQSSNEKVNEEYQRRRTTMLQRRLKQRGLLLEEVAPARPYFQPRLPRATMARCIRGADAYMRRLRLVWSPAFRSRADDGRFVARDLPTLYDIGMVCAEALSDEQFDRKLADLCGETAADLAG